jgi:uncharacterized repeat protein (TIGR03803 family)
MPTKKLSIGFAVLLAIFAVTMLMTAAPATAQTVKVLYGFNPNLDDGLNPSSGLISDADGNLYGTTIFGGATGGNGTVFELVKMCGHFTEKVLHRFDSSGDGIQPTAGVIFDKAGNLYGTTSGGGAYGAGTVFELSPTDEGGWTEKILHSFNFDGNDGSYPLARLIFDAAGNLYGTTDQGGIFGDGTAFELVRSSDGVWTEKILHNFGHGEDGAFPFFAGLIFDAAGNLYGTTTGGGGKNAACGSANGCGTVFELFPNGSGDWTVKILHNFGIGEDGSGPIASVIFDAAGNLYGTTTGGGPGTACQSEGCGTVFELSPTGSGDWAETVLYSFRGSPSDGYHPQAGLIFDASGNLYGTTGGGGDALCPQFTLGCGTAFELTPAGGGVWSETVLHSFGTGLGGIAPAGGLILDDEGDLYGTTSEGGPHGSDTRIGLFGGTVFEIIR